MKMKILILCQEPGVNVYDMLKSAAKSAKSLLPKTLVGWFKHFLIRWIVCYQVALSAVEISSSAILSPYVLLASSPVYLRVVILYEGGLLTISRLGRLP
jgi:hypothetical protein